MKTLYVSDLDGTLLRSNQKISEYTNEVINKIVRQRVIIKYTKIRANKIEDYVYFSLPL